MTTVLISTHCREASQTSNLTDTLPHPHLARKLTGPASLPGTSSGKTGVDKSSPVHSVVTPPLNTDSDYI